MVKSIIDIPVYSCTKEKYEALYHDYLSRFSDQALKYVKSYGFPNSIWEYNNIIGYISVSLDPYKRDIIFDVYKHLGKIYIFTTKRRPVQNILSDGWHFKADNLSNYEIAQKTKEMVTEIAARYFERRYVDMQTFENIINYIDFRKIMEDITNGQT